MNISIIKRKLKTAIRYANGLRTFSNDKLIAKWINRDEIKLNWGDALNPILINKLSGKKVIHFEDVVNIFYKPVYSVIGSHLGQIYNENTIIWGTGFGCENHSFQLKSSRNIKAVRGPLSAKKIRQQGFECPDVFGDPALLYPLFYFPDYRPKYKLGVIAHISDLDSAWYRALKEDEDILKINIKSGIKNVVDQINKCERIASSALHGIIAADSYGIPTIRLKISENPLIGDGFKYLDYYESVKRSDYSPMLVSEYTTSHDIIEQLEKHYQKPELNIYALIKSCPFIEERIGKKLNLNRVFNNCEAL